MRVAEKGVALEETGLARYRPRPVRLSGPGTLTDTPYIQEAAGGVRDTLSMGSPNAGAPPPPSTKQAADLTDAPHIQEAGGGRTRQ